MYNPLSLNNAGLSDLMDASREAVAAYRKVYDERCKKKSDLLREAESRIDTVLDEEYKQRLDDLRSSKCAAEQAVLAEKERLSESGDGAPLTLGTKVVRWKRSRYGSSGRYHKTNVVGIIEAVTRGSRFPANTSKFSKPSIGSYIVRILDKNGNPTLKFSEWKPLGVCWCTEDIDPNREREGGISQKNEEQVAIAKEA